MLRACWRYWSRCFGESSSLSFKRTRGRFLRTNSPAGALTNLRGWGDRLVLLATFGLTVAFDLTVAIEVGVVLAAFLTLGLAAEPTPVSTLAPVCRT